jgi:hypothetical protein
MSEASCTFFMVSAIGDVPWRMTPAADAPCELSARSDRRARFLTGAQASKVDGRDRTRTDRCDVRDGGQKNGGTSPPLRALPR